MRRIKPAITKSSPAKLAKNPVAVDNAFSRQYVGRPVRLRFDEKHILHNLVGLVVGASGNSSLMVEFYFNGFSDLFSCEPEYDFSGIRMTTHTTKIVYVATLDRVEFVNQSKLTS